MSPTVFIILLITLTIAILVAIFALFTISKRAEGELQPPSETDDIEWHALSRDENRWHQ